MILASVAAAGLLTTVWAWARFGIQHAATLVGLVASVLTIPATAWSLLSAEGTAQHRDDTRARDSADHGARHADSASGGTPVRNRAEVSITISVGSPSLGRVLKAILLAAVVALVIAVVKGGASGAGPMFDYH